MTEQRELGANFSEFFGAMWFLSTNGLRDIAVPLKVSEPTVRNWIHGKNVPEGHDPKIAEYFGLSEEETSRLRVGSVGKRIVAALTPRELLAEAVTHRLHNGPPLSVGDVQAIALVNEILSPPTESIPPSAESSTH